MRVIATFKPILGRADELDVGTMVMEFTAAGKDRIQVTYTHFLGYENREPRFELFLEHQEAEVIISEEEAVLKSGKTGNFLPVQLLKMSVICATTEGMQQNIQKKSIWQKPGNRIC